MKWTAIAVAIAAIIAAGAYIQHQEIQRLNQSLNSVTDERDKLQARINKIQTKTTKAQATAQSNRIKVKEVLDESPEFRDVPVPAPIVDQLCKVLRCP